MLIRLSNAPRDYAWGSSTLIAELEGRAPSGRPEAEVWFGDHPGCPALVEDGTGRTLDRWLADAGHAPLPYLLKLLAAASPLSIQSHPSKAQAAQGFAREEALGIARDAPTRTYRDDNHKPELIVAVSPVFRALAGLRPLTETRRLVAALGDGPGPRALAAHLDAPGDPDAEAAALRDTVAWLLSGEAQTEVDDVIEALADAESEDFTAELIAARRIAEAYPGDPGVVVALLMNLVELRRGEAVFVDAGALHAYLEGLGVELMAASDNVLRGGLTPKHIDVPDLLRIADTTPSAAPRLEPRGADGTAGGARVFDAGIPDFALTQARVAAGEHASVPVGGPAIALVTAGEVTVIGSASGAKLTLRPGQAAFVTEDEGALAVTGGGELFVAQPGRA